MYREMKDRKKYLKVLNRLWEENFQAAQFYRRASGAVTDPILKAGLLRSTYKNAQFAFELSKQIEIHGGKPQCYELKDRPGPNPITLSLTTENSERIAMKSISVEKESFEHYHTALSSINHGPTREILIRHKALISGIIKELQQLLSLRVLPEGGEKNKQG